MIENKLFLVWLALFANEEPLSGDNSPASCVSFYFHPCEQGFPRLPLTGRVVGRDGYFEALVELFGFCEESESLSDHGESDEQGTALASTEAESLFDPECSDPHTDFSCHFPHTVAAVLVGVFGDAEDDEVEFSRPLVQVLRQLGNIVHFFLEFL